MDTVNPLTTPHFEAATGWRRSTRCSPSGDNCVEVRFGRAQVDVRKSSGAPRTELMFASTTWRCFIAGIRTGDLTTER
jgi:hypothetical protein